MSGARLVAAAMQQLASSEPSPVAEWSHSPVSPAGGAARVVVVGRPSNVSPGVPSPKLMNQSRSQPSSPNIPAATANIPFAPVTKVRLS